VESYNEVSLVDTETYAHFPMVVGQNPRQVKFTDESDLALVVSDAQVALIDLTVAEPEPRMVEVAEDPLDPRVAQEVVVGPDGSYAFVRQYGADDIVVLDLVLADVERLAVGTNPTDLDLTPDGTKAVVVCRGSRELWLLDTADPGSVAQVLSLPDELLGSLLMTPDGSKGLLYTTAALTDRYAVWDVAAGSFQVRELVKPVAGMTVSPTGETLLVFHTVEDADGADPASAYYGEWALTLLDLDDFRVNPLVLAGEPTAFAHADDGEKGYFIMEGEPYLVVMDYGSLQADDLELKSLPLHVGTLPTTTWAYVSQTHDLGRISFYQGADGSMETITGFELNGETEH
jgi:DNA-binding beta-propeller fold protein YncE